MRSVRTRTTCLLIGLTVALCAIGCSKKALTPEAQVRKAIDAIETAVDARDVDGVMEHVAKGYSDQEGQKKRGLRAMLALRFMRQGSIHSLVRVRDLRVQPTQAKAELSVAIAATPIEDESFLEGLRADMFDLSITFEKVDDAWQVRRAEWDRGGLDLFE